jgi:UDP-N-acetylglucosamine--N-acetylmuramyl-(pentapeptide) pyrophosphoryl-undecaprenol N-acetylglucosamine transferase
MTYAFAAAGTGGHVYPAIAVADALVSRGVDREAIVFFGGDRMEATTVPAAGYRFEGIEIRGLKRSLSVDNLRLPGLLRRATAAVESVLRTSGTKVMTAFGGYVSVPAAWAAHRVGATLFVHEQNAVPGLANRLIARRAATSFVAFPAAARRLPRSQVVGNPIRGVLRSFDRDALRHDARKRYDLPDDSVVLGVLGGSLGARVLNDVTRRIADGVDPERVAIVHLTGADHHAEVTAEAVMSAIPWRTVAFEREMEFFYAAVDLVLGRAGALTISEIAATATPAVVVPLAAVAQEGNAEHLVSVGAAVAIPETEIDRVPVEIEQLLADADRRHRMGRAAAAVARPAAADDVAAALLEAAA